MPCRFQTLLIASRNRGKILEYRQLIDAAGLAEDVRDLTTSTIPETVEHGATYEENARLKARDAMRATGLPCLGDDGGIEIAALDGAPTLVVAFGGSRLGALRRRCGDAGVALAALREAGDATMRTTLREALMALLTGAAAPASRYDGDEAFYAPGEAALDAPDGDDGVVEEPASSPKVIEDRDAWLQSLAARAGDQEAPATPTAAAAAAAPTPESSNARSFFEGLLNSPGK